MKVVKGFFSAILVVLIAINLILIGCLAQVRTVISADGLTALIAAVEPETVYEALDDDVKETIGVSLEAAGVPRENIGKILETDAAKEIVSLVLNTYRDEFLSGSELSEMEILPTELVERVFARLEENERELCGAMYGSSDAAALAKYRAAVRELREAIDTYADELPETLGELSEASGESGSSVTIGENGSSGTFRYRFGDRELTGPELLRVLSILTGGVPIGILAGLAAIWLLLIFLMWRKRLVFLPWFSIPFLLTAPVFLLLSTISSRAPEIHGAAELNPNLVPVVDSLLTNAAGSFRLYGLILAFVAVLCIVLYIAFRPRTEEYPPADDAPRFMNDAAL